ncbi:ABC transporter substrate-binding protein [Oscillatoria sp. FACHB-1406]|uniref:ABC transporter substrate-binding protein n=1 Tax=Oscillatoria sp. FACHB-1406 TaxID=2692846 RepID=UPI001685643C|nr:ABC transporter substrate-binding protein [Oscillatoria sp. FACHB-1406]MBD2578031.1 ABC transporter substrate-binding protein [Oscillatoria sp. FACHB-1406]
MLVKLKPIFLFLFAIALVVTTSVQGCVAKLDSSPKPLRVGMNNWPGYAIALYAKDAGLFKKRGLNVELVRFNNQQDNIRATIRGSLDASFVPLWEAMQVDPGDDRPAYIMAVDISYGSDGIVARPNLNSVAELRGKTVAAKLGTVSHLILLEALKASKLQPNDIEIKDVSNDTAVQLLKQGQVDAAVVWEPLLGQTAREIGGKIIFTTKDVDSLVIDGLATRASYANEHQAELVQFILAWFDTIHAVETQPDKVFENIAQQLNQTKESFTKDYSGLKQGDIALNQRMFDNRLQQAKQEIIQLLKNDTRHRQVIREDIQIDDRAVKTAMKEWKKP